MKLNWHALASIALLGGTMLAADVYASSQVSYGRITNVRQVDIQNQRAQNTGALVGGALGVASGSGQSRSNRALRGVGGAAVGNRVGGAAGSTTGFEYTVLIGGTNTIRITTEQAGLRVGDCVSVERGQFNNIRLVSDDRCNPPAARPAPAPAAAPARAPAAAPAPARAPAAAAAPAAEDVAAANACDTAKQQLLDANTDADFDRAERRMRLLCGD
jgi:outer membrane lipoprotein SlyB